MSSMVSIILAFMLMIVGNPGYINSTTGVPDANIENQTTFEKEKAIKYDHLHNILSIVENFNGQTKTITTDIPENSVYSKLNQYASFDQWGLAYDKKGNTTQRGTQQLAYDYRNQIVTAVDAPSNTQVEMKYDVLGRRIQKSVTIGSQTKIENYYHSGQQVIEVRDSNDQLLRQYIYGNGIDEIIRMDKYEGDTFNSYYYHTDANGSVTAITDADGNLVERVTYDIYGMPTFWDAAGNKISKSSIGNNILFHGREYDTELNLYYFRARYYCPIMGRFLQTDPMGYQDSMNLYQGFNMNPYNFFDPFGMVARTVGYVYRISGTLKSKMVNYVGSAKDINARFSTHDLKGLLESQDFNMEIWEVEADVDVTGTDKKGKVLSPRRNVGRALRPIEQIKLEIMQNEVPENTVRNQRRAATEENFKEWLQKYKSKIKRKVGDIRVQGGKIFFKCFALLQVYDLYKMAKEYDYNKAASRYNWAPYLLQDEHGTFMLTPKDVYFLGVLFLRWDYYKTYISGEKAGSEVKITKEEFENLKQLAYELWGYLDEDTLEWVPDLLRPELKADGSTEL
jgi:RHS repeat-associated protein